VTGLNDFPSDAWPPVAIVHIAFQIMIAAGLLMMLVAIAGFWKWRQGRLFESDRFFRVLMFAAPLGFLAIEAGWIVTEVGRQPWIIQGIMRTADAVTPMPGLVVPFLTFTILYLFLAAVVTWLLYRLFQEAHD
jgi:cytochrome d ubiquinol oxidase subunit I